MVLCRGMLRKSQSSHVIFSFSFLFVCALDMHCFRTIPRGKPELILEKTSFYQMKLREIKNNNETLFHALVLPSVSLCLGEYI